MKVNSRKETRIDEEWHLWFAWFPVRINNFQLAWLECVMRKGTYHEDNSCDMYQHSSYWTYEYKEPL